MPTCPIFAGPVTMIQAMRLVCQTWSQISSQVNHDYYTMAKCVYAKAYVIVHFAAE